MRTSYVMDNSARLYLAQIDQNHTNVYRFFVILTEPVRADLLQKAADRVFSRFPTIFEGVRPTRFSYCVFPVESSL